ncbi:hypothetical protein ACJBU6_09737 [Exserohilum turcicum]
MQAVSNIITDIVYVASPILYLSTIQLSQQTRWDLRVVFCLGLVVTFCSVMKTTTLPTLLNTKDPTWESTDLVIWLSLELSVGILIAALPPLRKQFDALFRKMLPSTLGSRRKTGSSGENALPLYDVATEHTIGSKPIRIRSKSEEDDDTDSERRILSPRTSKGEITKTVTHEVRSEDRNSVQVPERTHNMYG